MKVLANDGIAESGKNALEEAGYEVILTNIPQEELEDPRIIPPRHTQETTCQLLNRKVDQLVLPGFYRISIGCKCGKFDPQSMLIQNLSA